MLTPEREGLVLELQVPAQAKQLKRIRDAARECVERCGCSAQSTADIVLALDEACQNIIRHAYDGQPDDVIELEIEHRGDQLIFSLTDRAPAIDPTRIKPRDLDDVRPGGLGIHFIRRVMDEAEYLKPPSGHGNLLRMVRQID